MYVLEKELSNLELDCRNDYFLGCDPYWFEYSMSLIKPEELTETQKINLKKIFTYRKEKGEL